MQPDSEIPAAFGLKGRKQPKSKLHERQKTRIRSTSKTRTDQIAFVRDRSIEGRGKKSGDFRKNTTTSTDKKRKKSKSPKTNSSQNTELPGARMTPTSTKSFRRGRSEPKINSALDKARSETPRSKKEKSHKKQKRKSKDANFVGDQAAAQKRTQSQQETIPAESTLTSKVMRGVTQEKVPKRKRRKKGRSSSPAVVEEITSSNLDESQDHDSVETIAKKEAIEAGTKTVADSKVEKKSKRRKKSSSKRGQIDSSSSIEEDVESGSKIPVQSHPDGATVQSVEEDTTKDDETVMETEDKLLTESSQSQSPESDGNLPHASIDMINASDAVPKSVDEVLDRESSLAAEAEDIDDSVDASVDPTETSVDDAARLMVEVDQSIRDDTAPVSDSSNEEQKESQEAVINKEFPDEDSNDITKMEAESKGTSIDASIGATIQSEEQDNSIVDESEACEKDTPQIDAEHLDGVPVLDGKVADEENIDTIGSQEKETERTDETSSSIDTEIVDEKPITTEENCENENIVITRHHAEETEIGQEQVSSMNREEARDYQSTVKEKADPESTDKIEDNDEETEIDAKEISEEDSITDDVEGECEDLNGQDDETTNIAEKQETQEQELDSINASTRESDDAAEIAEEEALEDGLNLVEDESILSEKNGDVETEETDDAVDSENRTEIVQEEILEDNCNRNEDETITEQNDEVESEETDKIENDGNDGSDNHTTLEDSHEQPQPLKTHPGVSIQQNSNIEISSSEDSEDSDFDPQQDVVSFIEGVLNENVRSWIEESDSHLENIVNKTRGGHTDDINNVDENVVEADIIHRDEGLERNSDDEVFEISEIAEVSKDTRESIEETKEAVKIMDRESLEKMQDQDSDAVVSVVTWNLAEDSPSEEDAAFLRKFRKNGISPDEGSDLVLISGQECENIKPRRSEGRRSREYRRLMIKMLGKDYVPLALHLLGGIQFGLFAKRSFLKDIEGVSVADVTCGIGNVFHNKGAIAAFVKVKARNESESEKDKKRSKSLRMVFVTAHLAAHVKNVEARDSDFWRISSELEAQAPEGFLPRKPTNNESSGSFLFDSVDRVFFCGDLNYRVDLPRELTEHTILHETKQNKSVIKNLLRHDQLIQSMAEGRAFPRFGEGKIAFMPTFKYDKESSSYDTSHKQRIPAWTDRILFQPTDGIRVLDYQSVPESQSSDHRPVYGTYRIGMQGRIIEPVIRKKKRRRTNDSFDSNYR